MAAEVHDDHVRLWAGDTSAGEPVFEMVPAEHLGGARYRLLGTPGLALGCAARDVVSVAPDGRLEVDERGGNVAAVAYLQPEARSSAALDTLRTSMEPLGALVESPPDLHFLVVTVPVTATFNAIEGALTTWSESTPGSSWYFANVFDADDKPLNWW
ncbi:uncharacterized protein DUF4265 [Asanoa ferruginea]|uniref:Uncharacterized protein DUF4265 n=1 Tax=Asanoa ferruginea TaxID=53367 RepID=A0A3D9ZIT7_9ACTN|nr:DUF4265 domain-containing protein [Asanoa ferruginea]REF96444.1 uncharacterized protein DUF4265 [Asanoa ferruginea]GIF50341.1 hypothetical protein Afe04nite_48800 [Asanoa ferruginea]